MSSVRTEERERMICRRRARFKTSDAGGNVFNEIIPGSSAFRSGWFDWPRRPRSTSSRRRKVSGRKSEKMYASKQ